MRVWDLAELARRLREVGLAPGFSVAGPSHLPATAPPRGLVAELNEWRIFRDFFDCRRDAQVNFNWRAGAASHIGPEDDFSVRWTGWLAAPRPGAWEVRLDIDGGGVLWLDGRAVFWRNKDQAPGPPLTAAVELPARRVSLRLDYRHVKGDAHCRLLWRPAGSQEPFVPVPTEAFTPE